MNSLTNKVGSSGHNFTYPAPAFVPAQILAPTPTPTIAVNNPTPIPGQPIFRDPNEISRKVEVNWSNLIGEPESYQSPDLVWKISSMCFTNVQNYAYKLLTIIFAPLFSIIMALAFAVLVFLYIWCISPLNKFFNIIFSSIRTFLEIILHGILGPIFETIGSCLSNIKIRHQKVHDVKEEPQFPFII